MHPSASNGKAVEVKRTKTGVDGAVLMPRKTYKAGKVVGGPDKSHGGNTNRVRPIEMRHVGGQKKEKVF